MIHTRDAKEADPAIHGFKRAPAFQMFVEAVRVERSDLIVLLTVVDEYFASTLFKPC
jgi:hypothetical protein